MRPTNARPLSEPRPTLEVRAAFDVHAGSARAAAAAAASGGGALGATSRGGAGPPTSLVAKMRMRQSELESLVEVHRHPTLMRLPHEATP